MIIGLAGVTSTGKSTLAGTIKDEFGDRVQILDKISRQEIYDYADFDDLTDKDLHRLSIDMRVHFDVARCKLQMKKEILCGVGRYAPLVIDGCAIVKVAYLIYLSGQYMVPKELDDLVAEVIEHCVKNYKAIFFLPVTRMPFTVADHRYFSSEWVRKGQDAILWRLLFREIGPKIDLNVIASLDNNLVLDQLRKMGV